MEPSQSVTDLQKYNDGVQALIARQEAHLQGMRRYEDLKGVHRWERQSLSWRKAEQFRAETAYIEALAKLELATYAKIEASDRLRSPGTGTMSDFMWSSLLTIY